MTATGTSTAASRVTLAVTSMRSGVGCVPQADSSMVRINGTAIRLTVHSSQH